MVVTHVLLATNSLSCRLRSISTKTKEKIQENQLKEALHA